MTRGFTCIICLNGREIAVEYEGGTVYAARGAIYPEGDTYVRQELTDPQRNVTTSTLVEGDELLLVSIRLSHSTPRKEIFRVMEVINTIRLQALTAIGQVILRNVRGQDADVIVIESVAHANA